jgi:hypothetical protein
MSEISALTATNMRAKLSLPLIRAAVISPNPEQHPSPFAIPKDTVAISSEAAGLQTPHK